MSLNVIKSQFKLSGIRSIPFWAIGSFFLYIFALINISTIADKTAVTTKITTDISEKKKPLASHNIVNLLKRPIFLAKEQTLTSKVDDVFKEKKYNIITLWSFILTCNNQKSLEKTVNIGFTQYIFAATQRAPPSLI